MHTEDSPIERTPDLVAKIRALREQAEKRMNQFTSVDDYDVRRVVGRKPKTESPETPPSPAAKKKRGRDTEQASLTFSADVAKPDTAEGGEA